MTDLPDLNAGYTVATDLDAREFVGAALSLFGLHRAAMAAGEPIISGRTFINCAFEGPSIALILDNVRFEACDFGNTLGDMRNILLRPVSGNRAIGTIPLRDCHFISCRFIAVGFTGPESFLQQMIAVKARP